MLHHHIDISLEAEPKSALIGIQQGVRKLLLLEKE